MKKVKEKISYDRSQKLGEGSFAIVYRGIYEDSKEVAIKRIQQAHLNHPINKKEVENEIKIMLEVRNHPNILHYIYYEENKDFL